jgi:hypothetical protein
VQTDRELVPTRGSAIRHEAGVECETTRAAHGVCTVRPEQADGLPGGPATGLGATVATPVGLRHETPPRQQGDAPAALPVEQSNVVVSFASSVAVAPSRTTTDTCFVGRVLVTSVP